MQTETSRPKLFGRAALVAAAFMFGACSDARDESTLTAGEPPLARVAETGSCDVYTNVLFGGESTKGQNGLTTIPPGARAVYQIYADVPAGGRLQYTQYDWNPTTNQTVQFGPGVVPYKGVDNRIYVDAQVIGPGVSGGATQVYCQVLGSDGASLDTQVGTFRWQ